MRQTINTTPAARRILLVPSETFIAFSLEAFLTCGQFLGPLRGAHYGFDEGNAQAALFEFENAVDGAAGGGGYGVFEQGGMVAGFEHHLGGAKGGLRG